MIVVAEPYRHASPQRVLSFMAGLCAATGRAADAEICLAQLTTLLAIPRTPAADPVPR